MDRKRLPFVLSGFLLLTSLISSLFVVGMLQAHRPVRAAAPSDWTEYGYDPVRSNYNTAETLITPSSASGLKQLWSLTEGSTISSQPTVASGKIYWGSWDGIEHATNLNGTQAWTANLGTVTSPTCGSAGIFSSAAAATETINGTPTSVVYVGGGNAQLYALDAASGAVLWHTLVGAVPNNVIWASPLVYNGSVYISTASLCDNPLTQGQVLRLNASTGAILNTFNVVANGCVGGGVWGSETIDPSNGTLYFASGTISGCTPAETMAYAIVQLNASNLSLMASWQVPAAQLGPDSDFGSTPTLFPATIGGTVHHLVGVANKNGIYYALDEANIGAGPVWEDTIAVGGPGPEKGDGSISPSAWDGSTLYVGGGNTTINGQSCQGGLRTLNPATGAVIWAQCMTDGPVMGSVTLVPGVVAVGEGTALWLMATSDGHTLFKTWDSSANSKYYAAPTIANGAVYVVNKDGKFSAYGLASPPPPTPTPSPSPSPTPTITPSPTPGSTLAQDTFRRPNQALWGTASDGQAWGGNANAQSVFSIANNTGQISNGTGAHNAILGPTATDAEVLFSGSISSFTSSNLGAVLRWTNRMNWYKASINGMRLIIEKRVSGTTTTLGTAAFAATAGTSYTLRFQVIGTTLNAKVWQTGTSEPANWMVTVTDTALTSGFCGLRMQIASGVAATYTSFFATVPAGTPTPTPTPSPSPTPTITPSPTPGSTLAQDTFRRPNQALWGTASDGQTWGGDANTFSAFSIANNTGQVSNTTTSSSAVLGPVAANAEVLFSGSMSNYTNNNLGAVLRWTDGNNWYKAFIDGASLVVQKKVNGATTILGSAPFAAAAGTSYTLRFRVVGTTLFAKVWQTGTTEPTNWMVMVTDSSLSSGFCGLRMLAQNGAIATYTSFQATAQ